MTVAQLWLNSSSHLGANAAWLLPVAAVVSAAAWVVAKVLEERDPKFDFPVVGSPDDVDMSHTILEGYKKYPDSPFVIPTKPPRVILPMSMYNEVVNAPEEKVSFSMEVHRNFLGQFTGVGQGAKEVVPALRGDLTKSIASILPLLKEEARYGFDRELGDPADWTVIPLFPKLLRVVALLSGRVFVGMPLSRNEEWIDMSINYTVDLAGVMNVVATWPAVLRPIVGRFLPEVRKANADVQRSKKFMEPLVREQLVALAQKEKEAQDLEKSGGANGNRPAGMAVKAGDRGTAIQWLLKYLPQNLRTADRVGLDQMQLTFAAIHTTTMTSMFALLDLAARPQCIKELREELDQVLREDGEAVDENGHRYLTKGSIAKLRKLDSFVKESQRLNPLGFVTSTRMLPGAHTFANGLRLPAGTRIAFPMWGVYHSDAVRTFSPEYNAETGNAPPTEFDGFRYARLREVPGRESSHQAVTTGGDSLNFGHGTHACPGRFFAIYEIKTMVLEFLRRYDFRLQGDVEGVGGPEKIPPNIIYQTSNTPNYAALLEIRRRQT